MFQGFTKRGYYFNIGICASFGLVYFILGIVNFILHDWSFDALGLAFFSIGGSILLFAVIAFIGKRIGVILLLIVHIGNPITMVAAIQALRYLNENGDEEVDLIRKKRRKQSATYFYQKKMKEKYKTEPINPLVSESLTNCPKCGHAIEKNSYVCLKCGFHLEIS